VNQFYKNLALWLVISLVMILLFNMMTQREQIQQPISYTAFLEAVDDGQIKEVTIQGPNLEGHFTDNKPFKTYIPDDPTLIKELRDKGVTIQAQPEEDKSFWFTLLVSWGPILLLIAVWIFFMRQMQSGGGKAMSFGKSRAKLLSDANAKVTFKDVAGIDEAKE
jgi:cell division protease FtsH